MRQIPVTCAHLHAVFSPPVRSESSARHQYHTTTRVRHGSVASSLHSLTIPLLSPAAVTNCLSIRWSRSVFFRGVLCVVWLIVVAIIRSFVVHSFVHHSFIVRSIGLLSFHTLSHFHCHCHCPSRCPQSSSKAPPTAAVGHSPPPTPSLAHLLAHSLTHSHTARSFGHSPSFTHSAVTAPQPPQTATASFSVRLPPFSFHCSTVPKVGIPIYKRYTTAFLEFLE